MMFLSSNGGGKASASSSAPKKDDAIELGKEWKRNLQKEARKIDRDILNIKRMEDKSMKECKALAKAGRLGAVKILAKEVLLKSFLGLICHITSSEIQEC